MHIFCILVCETSLLFGPYHNSHNWVYSHVFTHWLMHDQLNPVSNRCHGAMCGNHVVFSLQMCSLESNKTSGHYNNAIMVQSLKNIVDLFNSNTLRSLQISSSSAFILQSYFAARWSAGDGACVPILD